MFKIELSQDVKAAITYAETQSWNAHEVAKGLESSAKLAAKAWSELGKILSQAGGD